MKKLLLFITVASFVMAFTQKADAAVTYKLSYNSATQTYTVSFNSTVAYSGALARITGSTQFTVVAPDPDGVGAGSFVVTNLTNLTTLQWGSSQLNSPAENPTKDYIFFAPSNASSYTPLFNIPANTDVPLFTFQTSTPCSGPLYLFDNISDPLNSNGSINADNNFRTLGGGNNNLYSGNVTDYTGCSCVTYKLALDPDGQTYRVSFNSGVAFSGPLARITGSTQFTVVMSDPDGAGGASAQIVNITPVTGLQVAVSQLNSPAENPSKDYAFFAPSNANSYSVFNIPANTDIPLFTFQITGNCSGDVYLFDNVTDPLNTNVNINADNNFRTLGGGNVNLYCSNSSGIVPLPNPSITLGSIAPVCPSATSANLPYTATTGGPNQYSIDFNPAAEAAGFVDVVNATLPANTIVIALPSNAACGAYSATLTVRNSALNCVSTPYNITVTLEDLVSPVIGTCPPTENYEGCTVAAITSLAYSATEVTVTSAQFTGVGGAASDGCGIVTYKYSDAQTGSCPIVITRHWVVTDACGNSAQCNQTINVDDNTNPTASNPAPITVQCIADVPAQNISVVTDEADNCTASPTVAFVSDVSDGNTCPQVITRTYSVTDACGNSINVTQTITIDDTTNPTASNPAPITVQCVADVPAQNINVVTDEADNCTASPTVAFVGDVSDGNTCPQVITRTYSVTDACGNSINVTQTITIDDTTNPTASNPTPVTVQCVADVPAQNISVVTDEADNCTASPTVAFVGDVSDGNTCPQVITRTYSVTDACGNSINVTQTITIDDITNPTASNPAPITVQCVADVPAQNISVVTDEADNCTASPVVAFVGDVSDGNTCPQVITRTYSVTDACGNSINVTQTITIDDTTNPTASNPAPVAVQCVADVPAQNISVVTDEADNCTANPVVAFVGDVSDGNTCPQVITRTYSVTDACGNSINVIQTITIDDTTNPTASNPAPITVQCVADVPAQNISVVTDEADNCTASPVVAFVGDVSDGNTCPQVITRTYSVTDACGNSINVTQTITIDDITNPTASNPAPITVQCVADVPVQNISVVTDEADNCTASPVVAFVGDVSDGNTCPQIITRTYSVTDACGNSINVTQTITIDDTTNPTASNPAPITVQCIADVPAQNTSVVTDEADNCTASPVVAFVGDVSDGNTCPQVITRTYSVTDACGNSINVTQTITIDDTTIPTFTAPANITINADAACNYNTSVAATGDVTNEADNCSTGLNATFVDVSIAGSCPGSQIITRTWSLSDNCGNAAADQVQTITVRDNTPPVIVQGSIASHYPTLAAAEAAALSATSASDNCSGSLTTSVSTVGNCPAVVTVTVTDVCNNTSTAVYNTSIHNITLNPQAAFQPLCVGGSVMVQGNASGGNAPLTHLWTIDLSSTASGTFLSATNLPNVIVKGYTAGTLVLNYTLTDNTGCSISELVDVTVSGDCAVFGIVDPCSCNNDASVNGNNGSFSELVAVSGPGGAALSAGQTWTIQSIAGAFADDGTTAPGATGTALAAGATLTYDAINGYYTVDFDHIDAQGYSVTVEGPNAAGTTGNVFLTVANTCFYPHPVLVGPATVCTGSTPFNLQVQGVDIATNTQASPFDTDDDASTAESVNWLNGSSGEVNPSANDFPDGSVTVYYHYDAPDAPGTSSPGCGLTVSFTINANNMPPLSATISASTKVSCFGGSNGSATAASTGGTGTITYLWNNGQTTATATGLIAGSYNVVATDANGCTAETSVVITEPSQLTSSITAQTNVLCNGASTGSATLSATGGTTAYTYLWSNAQTTATATGLIAGVYTVIVTDANSCTVVSSVTITEPTVLVADIISQVNIGCNGAATGSATVNATGGTTAYSYLWSNTQTSATATGLTAGTYTVTVTDANGCTKTASATITQSPDLTASAAQVNAVSCFGGNNGSASVTASGGTPGYTFLWTSGSTDQTATGLTAGTYTVTVTDAAGCTETASTTITQPASAVTVSISASTNVSCFGGNNGSATAAGTGGTGVITYLWNNGQTTATATGLIAGSYNVVATDANGCTAETSVVITEPSQLTASITAQTNVLCNGASTGSATVTAVGGTTAYTYLWSNAQTTATATNLAAGTYTVIVTDANNCTVVSSVTITEPTVLIADIISQVNIGCNGAATGSATVNATGGTTAYSYLWSNAQTAATATGLIAETYTVTVTDANGCTASASATITESSDLTASAAQVSAVSCFGGNNGSASVTASGGTPGYTFLWGSGSTDQTATGLAAGTYTVTVTDASGCTETASATITQPNSSIAMSISVSSVSCFGGSNGSVTVSATNGTGTITYLWNTGQTTATISGLIAGSYNVTATDANGCTAVASATITQPTQINVSISAQTNVLCNGASTGSATVSAAGGTPGYTYLWSNAQTGATATNLAAGTYTVIVTDANNCTVVSSVTITQPTALVADIISQVNIGCNGAATGSATVNATGGTTAYSYLWSNTQTSATATGLTAGTYTVTVTDANGCTASASVTITQSPDLTAGAAQVSAISCLGGNDGSAGATATGGQAGYTYQWSSGSSDQIATGLAAGTYTVTVTDAAGCTKSASATISQPATAISATISGSNLNCFGGSNGSAAVVASGGTPAYTYLWNNGQTNASITGVTAGVYEVTITDSKGCTIVKQITITEPTQLTASISTQTNVLCNGAASGAATVTAAGGTTSYSYLWSNAQTSATATGLLAGTYTVTVTDANACTAFVSVIITQPTVLIAEIINQVNVGCNGAATGSATVNATGGTTTYTYLWSNAQTSATATGLNVGTYTVTVTDTNGCTKSSSVNITQASSLTASATEVTAVSCFGGSDGSAGVAATGGQAGYTYQWSSGSGDQIATNLAAGTYTVTVTDAAGCTATASVTISQPASAVSATISGTNVNCFGGSNGSAVIVASGGTAGYTYGWNNGQTTASISGLTAGVYEVTVTDSKGCTVVKQITITEPTQLTASISAQTNVLCNGANTGSATVTAAGGTTTYSYLWSNAQTAATATGLLAGTYTVTVTDANNCSAVASVSITQPTLLTIQVINTVNETCAGANNGSATVSASGGTPGYTFNWTGGLSGATQTGLAAGTYLVTVTDANSCTKTTSVVINAGATLSITSLSNLSALCPGSVVDDILVNTNPADPATVFSWTGGASIGLVNGSSTGVNPHIPGFTAAVSEASATITVSANLNGCISSATFSITIDDAAAPVFTYCPANLTFNNNVDLCNAVVTWSQPTASDNCGVPSITRIGGPAPGSVVNVGAPVTVTYQASDLGGNTTVCSFTVQVNDVQTPTAVCKNITVNLDNAGAVSVTGSQLNGGSSDNCTAAGALTLTPATTNFTCANIGNNNVTLTVTDAAGNTSVCVATITVHDVTAPVFTCPAPVIVPNCNATVPNLITGLSATDNCGVASITQNPLAGTNFSGSINVTITVSDVNGNVSTCVVPLSSQNTGAPLFLDCPTSTVTIGNNPDQCSANVSWPVPVALDNCVPLNTVVQTAGPVPGSVVNITCPPTPLTIVYQATDSDGNTATCSFQVIVKDTQKPQFDADVTMPTNITVQCHDVPSNCVFHGNGICSPLTADDINDNCSGTPTVTFNEVSTKGAAANACNFYNYTLTRTWTATDCSGNSRQHTQVINVHDTTKPLAVCKNITVTLNSFGTASILPRDLDGGSTDNCATSANLTFSAGQTVFTCADVANSPVSVTLTVSDPCGNTSTCTALVTVLQGSSNCTPEYDAEGSDPCVCLDNATTLTNGQFSEMIQVHGTAGQTWTIVSSTGFYLSSSPAPPIAPIVVPAGTVMINGLSDGIDNDGDALTDEADENVYYTYRGRHVDGIGYKALLRSNLNQEISLENKCYYPTPYFADFIYNEPLCIGTPAFTIQVNEINNAAGTVVPGSVMVDGIPTTTFDASTLGVGSHTVMATFDAGAAQPFTIVNGVVVAGSDLEAQADPGCRQKITQVINIVATPTTLTCDDLVHVSMDADCQVTVLPDDVLEGTYYCYDDYLVEVDKTLPMGNGPWLPANFTASDIGKTYYYHVVRTVGGPNVCWGEIKIEDKMPPGLTCPANITIACSESTDVSHTGNVLIADCSNYTRVVDDEYTDFGQCNTPRGQIVRTWIVTDVWGNQASCSQTVTIIPFDLDEVVFPIDVVVNCESAYLNPNATSPDVTGRPAINSFAIGQGGLCTASIGYTDQRLDICTGSYEILRSWIVRNTCLPVGPGNPITHVQVITVSDLGGPAFACPPAITVSTDPLTCCATAALPSMIVSEGCSNIYDLEAKLTGVNPANGNIITFTVGGHLEDFPGNNYWNPDTLAVFNYTQCLPLGTFDVRYKASDGCGNISYCNFELTVADLIPPVTDCDETTTVAISTDDPTDCYTPEDGCDGAGVSWVKAKSFDDGSYDNCSQLKFTVRRMAPYSDCINNLSHDPCYPGGLSEFDLATAELDSIKFYCCEVGSTQTVILRAYQVDLTGNFILGADGEPIYNECMIQAEVQDKIKPLCSAPAHVTVSCETFDPTLWLYGKAQVLDNCCLDEMKVYQDQCGLTHSASYSQFDTVCNKGTIIRTFRAFDCHGQTSQCTQRIVVNYNQDYFVKFPNDVIVTVCDGTGNYGEPQYFGEDCELLGATYTDAIFTVVPDACFKIERSWKIINWCTYDSNLPCINVPNPNPAAISNAAANLAGPTVSECGTLAPWAPTVVKINPTDAVATNFCTFWSANANCYTYKQIIKIIDGQAPTVVGGCPGTDTICDITPNNAELWNDMPWWDNTNQSHNLCEAPADICVTATDACSGSNINIEYQLFLDLDGDGVMETIINSINTGIAGLGWNAVPFGNANGGAGTIRAFDQRPVNFNQKYGFAIQKTVNGNNKTACVRFNTQQAQGTFVPAELPYGTHKIKWFISDGCGNESVCEYTIIVKDCKAPTVVCHHGLSVNIMPGGMIGMWDTDFLQYTEDNCTETQYLKTAIRKCGQGSGFPLDANAQPIHSVTFTCDELGEQCVEIWSIDLAGNADYCQTYIDVQDNNSNCAPNGKINVSGVLKTEGEDGVEEATVEVAGSSASTPFSYNDVTDEEGIYAVNASVPAASDFTITPIKDDNPLNGLTTYDLVLISKHILGVEPLGSPYKMIAADANKSNSITTFDIVELRKLILGIYLELPNNTSWRFVDKTYSFPNELNPFVEPFPENISIAQAQMHQLNQNFVGVKIGDVNNTVVANNLRTSDDRSNGTLLFDVKDRSVKAGEEVEVTFTAAEKTQGYQMTLNLNGLEVVDIVDGEYVTANNFGLHAVASSEAKEGKALTISIDGSDFFTVKFRATKAGKLSEMMSVSSRITKAEGYVLAEASLEAKEESGPAFAEATAGKKDIALRFDGKTIAGLGFELYQNEPNPFVSKTAIGFHLPEATSATLTVYDETGRLVFSQKGDFAKGYNTFTLERKLTGSTGALWYRVETSTDSAARTMIQTK